MATHLEHPIADAATVDRRAARKARIPVESWENEGGHLAPRPQTALIPTDISPVILDQAIASADLAAMRAKFISDFAGGAMGMHHNTYQHRSRVLHQLSGKQPD